MIFTGLVVDLVFIVIWILTSKTIGTAHFPFIIQSKMRASTPSISSLVANPFRKDFILLR